MTDLTLLGLDFSSVARIIASMNNKLHVGDRLLVKASAFLGTPEAWATVLWGIKGGYMVHIDGDDPDWYGPVDLDGTVLIELPSGLVRAP